MHDNLKTVFCYLHVALLRIHWLCYDSGCTAAAALTHSFQFEFCLFCTTQTSRFLKDIHCL